ncbi:cobalt-precorrin-6A reductase [Roseovarius sp. A21]|uniref:Cobalt-precorrin-6A reductase n=1 Tax=Roseovarius bejariae TaxID=2576383 RepID=A0A844CXS6_9RHOB|nr:cobalt-precorrin-6A reductase [Roseovarius bejariae]MRU14433.1 cobalt-precorrin-6A reductase [Roseovarius bejariae]
MTLLLLAGTGEAQAIAKGLAERGIAAIASLSGATRSPRALDLPTRVGGFGGADGFRAYLDEAGITAVLDATHPFAHRISHRTATICGEKNIPYCQVLRPEWQPEPGDDWTFLENEAAAAGHITPGATVFLATGRQGLDRFANLSGCRLICRVIDPPDRDFPFPNGRFLIGRPPFSLEDEVRVFTDLGVEWLIAKNAGGAASRTKLMAARELGIKVAMINRPPQPDTPKVRTVEEALAWAEAV